MSDPVRVELSDGRIVEFPAGMSQGDMRAALRRLTDFRDVNPDTTDDTRAAATRAALTGGTGQARQAVDTTIDARAAATQAAMQGGAGQPRYSIDTTDQDRAAATQAALGGMANTGGIIPPRAMPQNPQLVTAGPGAGGGMRALYDQGILPRRYEQGPGQPAPQPAPQPQAPRVNVATGATLDTTDDARAARGFGQTGYMSGLRDPGNEAPVRVPEGTVGDVVAGGLSGIGRGVAGMLDLPGQVMDMNGNVVAYLTERGYESVTGEPLGPEFRQLLQRAIDLGPWGSGDAARTAGNALTGGGLEYQPQTTAGEYAQTIGEFIPAAVAFGGPGGMARNALAYGVIPGAASEAAGQLTEGTPYEPYARAAGAVGASLIAGPMIGATQARPRPFGANPERQRLADILQREGIQPTAGQVTGSGTLRRMEGTVGPVSRQTEAVTAAAMRSIGSDARLATPQTLSAAERAITQTMDDVLSGVTFRPTLQMGQAADDIAARYQEMAPGMSFVPRLRGIADEIVDAATNPNAPVVSLTNLREWRTSLGSLLRSNDEATLAAAHGLRDLIDDATDAALVAAGRGTDLAALQEARQQYRDWLAVMDASTRAGSVAGVLSPQELHQAVIRVQSRRAVGTGRGTPMSEMTGAASQILRPLPTVNYGGDRGISNFVGMGGLGAGAYAGNALLGPVGAVVGGAIGAAAPGVGQAVMRSRAAQAIMMDPALSAAVAGRNALSLYSGR